MKKSIRNNEAYYTLAWSPYHKYDKYAVRSKVPELAGIVDLSHRENNRLHPVMFYSCWRDGCRIGLNKLLDPVLSRHPDLMEKLLDGELYFRYTVVDTTFGDMGDIMHLLIHKYRPPMNDLNFPHSNRYNKIHLKEINLSDTDVVEKFPVSN